ncbi:Hypothetical predicted protein [Podarcis lilfordi]|uniref:Uncharacterized protein n=1 Tax=Podarcis lilfordi TaxID=74358 RepID=A0AA35K0Q7_9SAUR|nr:Hypothetical predicted protein [Podarcis lilfordi]
MLSKDTESASSLGVSSSSCSSLSIFQLFPLDYVPLQTTVLNQYCPPALGKVQKKGDGLPSFLLSPAPDNCYPLKQLFHSGGKSSCHILRIWKLDEQPLSFQTCPEKTNPLSYIHHNEAPGF